MRDRSGHLHRCCPVDRSVGVHTRSSDLSGCDAVKLPRWLFSLPTLSMIL